MADSPEFWKITADERNKHNSTFMQLNPVSGTYLSGEQARAFFLKSGLATQVLGQIWGLADTNKDGKLDKKEFSIACYLIKKVLTSPQGASILPAILPNSLIIDPLAPAPVQNSTISPAMSGLAGASTFSTMPLFSATFPTSTPTPIVPLSTTNTSVPNTTPIMFPNTATPILAVGSSTTSPPLSTSLMGTMRMPTPSTSITSPLFTTPLTTPGASLNNSFNPSSGTIPTTMPTTIPTTIPTAITTTPGSIPGAVFTPLVTVNALYNRPFTYRIPNPIAPIPQTSRTKYGQMFQGNDPGSTGFISGQLAKTLLMQTGLQTNLLAQIWGLADHDKDGKLSYEEFIIAMHLCDFAKGGNLLPSTLPVELHPQRSRSQQSPLVTNTSIPNQSLSPESINIGVQQDSSPTLAQKQVMTSFEDKRRENFDRGNAVLEAKRQMLREQEEREKREREEKERLEQEKKQKIKEEQERRRLAEIEKQMERQRIIDQQREEERKKVLEQREAARNELIRQQRLEWEKQKKQELEAQKLKLQEQLSTLKAKDKNLEYDMQALNEKIATYKTKINDTQHTLTELNNRLDLTRKSYIIKQNEVESAEKQIRDYSQNLARLAQEKLYLTEQQKNLNQDNPFAEEYRNDLSNLKLKQANISQMKADLEKMESQINSTRTQLEIIKHELEVKKSDENDFVKENSRLDKLLEIKRNSTVGYSNVYKKNTGTPTPSASSQSIMKLSQSNNNLNRSATPKDNYDALKDEIAKIQQTVQTNGTKSNTTSPTNVVNDPFVSETNGNSTSADWANAFDQSKGDNSNGFGFGEDPFSSFNSANTAMPTDANQPDPFASIPTTNTKKLVDSFENEWSSKNKTTSNGSIFDSAFSNNKKSSLPTSTSKPNGFGTDDNWAEQAAVAAEPAKTNGVKKSTSLSNSAVNSPSFNNNNSINDAFAETNDAFNSNTNNNENSANWAAFDDEIKKGNSVKDAVSFFNANLPLSSPTTANDPFVSNKKSPSASQTPKLQSPIGAFIKYKAMFQFDATREDELSLKEGDIVNVDVSVKTDDGWLFGECYGRSGVFPADFTVKLSSLETIQENNVISYGGDAQTNGFSNSFAQQPASVFEPPVINTVQQTIPQAAPQPAPVLVTNIKNYFLSIYAYISNEVGDLNFREFEIINVIDKNEDWLTGQVVGSGAGPNNPLRHGIFPSNFVIKFNIPIDYIGKFTISMATEPYQAQNNGELNLNPAESQLIAIKKLSPDGKWSFGETYDLSGQMKRGWFPINSATPLIDAGAVPLYVPSSTADVSPTTNTNNNSEQEEDELENEEEKSKNIEINNNSIITNNEYDDNDDYTVIQLSSSYNTATPPVACIESLSSSNSFTELNPNNISSNLDEGHSVAVVQTSASTTNNKLSSTTSANSIKESIFEPTKPVESPTSVQPEIINSSKAAEEPAAQSAVTTPIGVIDQVIALYDFTPTTPETIGFPKDAVINILEKSGDWWLGEYNGKMGLLPYNYVQSILKTNETKKAELRDTTTTTRSPSKSSTTTYRKTNRSVSLSVNLNRDNKNHIIQEEIDKEDLEESNNYINNDFHTILSEYYQNTNIDTNNLSNSQLDLTSLNNSNNNNTQNKTKEPKLKMRGNVVNEIVQTEKSYVKSLRTILELYKNPLQQNRILTQAELDNIFVNLDDIIPINTSFLQTISKRVDDAKQTEQVARVGDIFTEYLPKMKIYTKYVSAKRFGEDIIHEKMKSSNEFFNLVNKATDGDTGEFLLKKMLLLPMQRLTQYSLLLDKLIKYVPESDDDYQNLKTASKLTVDLIKSINVEVGKKDDLERLEWLEEHVIVKGLGFKFRSATNMMGPRKLYYYGPLIKESGKELYAFLFNDTLVIVEANESTHGEIFKSKGSKLQLQLYKNPILLDTVSVVQSRASGSNSDCSFQIQCGDKEFSFKTTNPTLKNEWVKQIQKSVELYKQKKRSLTQSTSAFSLSQKNPIGRFLLLIMEAQDLAIDTPEKNVFCEATMGLQKFSTHTIDSGNPKWNTSMQFQIYDLNKEVLNVVLYDKKVYSPNLFLGKAELRVQQIYREQIKENQEAQPITRVFRMSNVPCGKVMLKMSISIYK